MVPHSQLLFLAVQRGLTLRRHPSPTRNTRIFQSVAPHRGEQKRAARSGLWLRHNSSNLPKTFQRESSVSPPCAHSITTRSGQRDRRCGSRKRTGPAHSKKSQPAVALALQNKHQRRDIKKAGNHGLIEWWRRGESNPRPRSLATRSLHAYPVPKVSPAELRAGKTRCWLVR